MVNIKETLTKEQQKQLDDWADALIKEHEQEEEERAKQDALFDIARDEEEQK